MSWMADYTKICLDKALTFLYLSSNGSRTYGLFR